MEDIDTDPIGHRLILAPELHHIEKTGVDVKTREMFVDGEIEEDFGGWFSLTMRYLERHQADQSGVTVWLNTPGGDVNSMFTFHDLVRATQCEVTIIATGQVCSAGVLMLACGNRRLVTESCVLMSHRGEDTLTGHLEQMEAQMKVVKWQERHWAGLMSRYTPRDAKYWFELGKKSAEWWVTGGESIIKEGLADAMWGG